MANRSTTQEIRYIAKHYRKGRFNAGEAWKRLSPASSSRMRVYRIAAAIAALAFLSATAAVIYHHYELKKTPVEPVAEPVSEPVKLTEVVKVIDFENAPLTAVVLKIKEVYGVEVVNVPENADDYHLSLHYEGNAVDLVATINDILETQIAVRE